MQQPVCGLSYISPAFGAAELDIENIVKLGAARCLAQAALDLLLRFLLAVGDKLRAPMVFQGIHLSSQTIVNK